MSHNTGKSALPDIYAPALALGHRAYICTRPRHRAHIRTHPRALRIHIRRVRIYQATRARLRCGLTYARPRSGTVHAYAPAPGHRAYTSGKCVYIRQRIPACVITHTYIILHFNN